MRIPTKEEALRRHKAAIRAALKHRCPACSERLTGHRYSDYAAASESQELVTVLLKAFDSGDWKALAQIQDVNVMFDIWTVILLECPKHGTYALEMLDYYEPALSLQYVKHRRFEQPPGLELRLEWRELEL